MHPTGFNGGRLTLARMRRGHSVAALARLMGMDSRTISGYERGEYDPPEEKLATICKLLRFPKEFFFRHEEQPGGERPHDTLMVTASFRSLARLKSGQKDAALGSGLFGLWLARWTDRRVMLPEVNVPDLRGASPAAAAREVREHWALGERPINNLVHLLESKGVRVYSLAEDTLDVDAFCLWHGTEPFMFLNTAKSAEHSRFDAAHELGHLVLHRHAEVTGKEAELEANAFASAFLMPEGSVRAAPLPRVVALDYLIKLKKLWKVSLAALVYRLNALGLIGEWHYKQLCIELSARGFRKQEPEPGQREVSQVLPKIFDILREDGLTRADIARELALDPSEIEALCFGLRILEGGGRTTSRGHAPKLTLVK